MTEEKIYAAIAEIYSITLQFLTVEVMIFEPPRYTNQKRKLIRKIGRSEFEKSRVCSHHF